jgi:hypothetical protein
MRQPEPKGLFGLPGRNGLPANWWLMECGEVRDATNKVHDARNNERHACGQGTRLAGG